MTSLVMLGWLVRPLVWSLLWQASTATPPSWVLQSTIANLPATISVPTGFIGLSIEWIQIDYLVSNPSFATLISTVFGQKAGPLSIRIGGNSQDGLNTPVPTATWMRLASLANQTRCQYIIGLNLAVRSNPCCCGC